MNKAGQDMFEEVRRRAENYFKQGYNCAQAVALSNLELLGAQTSGIMQLAAGFGHGMSAGCTCGALMGGVMAISSLFAGPETKGFDREITEAAAQLHREFVNEFGTACCRGLRKELSPYKNKKCREITAKTAVLTLELLLSREMTSAPVRVQLL
jgi:C_GCAxxG_C_C family probable redox protein